MLLSTSYPKLNASTANLRLRACGYAPGLCESDDLLLMRKSRADVGEEGEGSCCCEEGVELEEMPEEDSWMDGSMMNSHHSIVKFHDNLLLKSLWFLNWT